MRGGLGCTWVREGWERRVLVRLGAGGKRFWRDNWVEVGRALVLSDFFCPPFEMQSFGREEG